MTAINAIVLHDRAILVSDGLLTSPGSTGLTHKVSPIAHLSAVVGFRGLFLVKSAVTDALAANAACFDDLRLNIVSLLNPMFDQMKLRILDPETLDAEIVVAGWSETCGPSAFILATSDFNAASGLPAWKTIDIPGALFSPDDNGTLAAKYARDDFVESDAIELVEQQSRMRPDVGGFVQMSTVRKSEITTRILRRF